MTKAKNTKRALLVSVLSMMLCMAMLVGSTFAWFTDSVTSGVNKIVAGNLDVEMEYAVLNEDGSFKEWKPVKGVSLFDENALWEPGYTQVVYLKISNVGSLSLNYKLSVDIAYEKYGIALDENGEQVRFNLSDYLKFGAVATEAENFFADRVAARAAIGENAGKLRNHSVQGSIKASEKDTDVDYVALVVYMPETVKNEANHISNVEAAVPYIELGIKLEATQMMDEKDSFGNNYDKNAFQNNEQTPTEEDAFANIADPSKTTFDVKTEADLLKLQDLVLNGTDFTGKTIKLANNITLSQNNWTPIGTATTPFTGTFDGDNHTISGLKIISATGNRVGFFGNVKNATIKNLTLEGAIDVTGNSIAVAGFAAEAKGESTFENCTNNVSINVTGTQNTAYGIASGDFSGTELYTLNLKSCTNAASISISGTGSFAASITLMGEVAAFTINVTDPTITGTVTAADGAKATNNAYWKLNEMYA